MQKTIDKTDLKNDSKTDDINNTLDTVEIGHGKDNVKKHDIKTHPEKESKDKSDQIDEIIKDESDIVKQIIEDEPEPSDLSKVDEKEQLPQSSTNEPTDKNGDTFNSEIHLHDNGNPELTPKGKLKLKRGRKKGVKLREKVTSKNDLSNKEENPNDRERIKATAKIASEMTFSSYLVGAGLFGCADEFVPETVDRDVMNHAYETYFEATGTKDLPPSLVLLFAHIHYVSRRFTKPKTQSAFKRAGIWIKKRWRKIRNKQGVRYESEPEKTTEYNNLDTKENGDKTMQPLPSFGT